MREITKITPDGVHYIDDEDNSQFIDFATCQQNNIMNLKKSMGSRWTEKDEDFYQRAKYVGVRYALSDPPHLAFYTKQLIMFEFPTRESLGKVLYGVKKAGWRTNDGE